MKKTIRSLADLREEKRSSDEKIKLHGHRIKALYHVKIMDIVVPRIIRDDNHKIDFTKAIAHLSIAALPLVYKSLKKQSDLDFTKIMDLLDPFLQGFNQNVQNQTADNSSSSAA